MMRFRMVLQNLLLFFGGIGRHMFMVVDSSGKDTMSSLSVSPVVLAGHLCWLAAQYMLLLTDCRMEVIVSIVFKHTVSKSSISSGWHPPYRFVIILQGAKPFGHVSLQTSLLLCPGFSN